jgi:precorrin-2/cobalt-factor-2 C20-methyltransferase
MTGTLVGVGVGPGDPDLLTIKGRDALQTADVVFVPVAAADQPDPAPGAARSGQVGYAERVVRAHVTHDTPLHRLVFILDGDPERRAASWEAAGAAVAAALAAGRRAAFATIGDPNVYSTFTQLARVVRARLPDAPIETVPGITALQDLAARSGAVLVERDERLALLPFTAGEAAFRTSLEGFDAVVCYKGGRRLPEVVRAVTDSSRARQVVYGARLGLTGQDLRAARTDGRGRIVGDLPDGPAPYLSTVIVTPDRSAPAPDQEAGS